MKCRHRPAVLAVLAVALICLAAAAIVLYAERTSADRFDDRAVQRQIARQRTEIAP